MNLLQQIQHTFRTALEGLVADVEPYVAMVKPAQDAKHGDYQANCAMSLAKVLGKKPRDVAQEIVARLDLGDLLQPPEIAGPGFINLRLQADWMARRRVVPQRRFDSGETFGCNDPECATMNLSHASGQRCTGHPERL